ncbi:MAG: hypothetical protein OXE78_12070 [Gammaproteobacteria bacterium]|nr:hypothetical protein [Gammaproteobacteria bacterium]MCY4357266.1 hypothetical protein [Gammaproteobacteria bacterium]
MTLEDIDENNGPLIFYPERLKLPEYSMQNLGLECGNDYCKSYELCIQQSKEKHELKAEYSAVKMSS